MKNFKVDNVQVVAVVGSLLAMAGSMLTNHANDKKLDGIIDEKVAKAVAEQLAKLNQNKGE